MIKKFDVEVSILPIFKGDSISDNFSGTEGGSIVASG
jgi:hypothetical protein